MTSGDIHGAMDAWLAATQPLSVSPEPALNYRLFGSVRAVLEAESSYLVLVRIETPPDSRGEGQASELLEWLKHICNRHEVTVLGQAHVDDESGLDQTQLLAWYARHDFQADDSHQGRPLVWYPERPD